MRNPAKVKREIQEEIIRLYENIESQKHIAIKVNLDTTTISKILKINGIPIRSNSETAVIKSGLNEKCFDLLNKDSEYWIGFLLADGCITKRRSNVSGLSLYLSQKDTGHLVKFKKFLGTNNKIIQGTRIDSRTQKQYDYCSLAVSSTNICSKLISYGVTQRKSCIAKILNQDLKLSVDFWRGYIDGNGSINLINLKHPALNLCGSYDLVKDFILFVNKVLNLEKESIPINQKNIYVFNLHGSEAIKIIKILYEKSSIYLERKYSKVMEIIKLTENKAKLSRKGKRGK